MVLGRVRHYGVPAAGLIAFVATTDFIMQSSCCVFFRMKAQSLSGTRILDSRLHVSIHLQVSHRLINPVLSCTWPGHATQNGLPAYMEM